MDTFTVGQYVRVVAPHPEHAALLEAASKVRRGRKYLDSDTGQRWQNLTNRARRLKTLVGQILIVEAVVTSNESSLYRLGGQEEFYPSDCVEAAN